MNAEYLHKACHAACIECPQFRPYDHNSNMGIYGDYCKFGDFPKLGLYKTVMYWRRHPTLWESGYSKYLPNDVRKVFLNINGVIDMAIRDYCKSIQD